MSSDSEVIIVPQIKPYRGSYHRKFIQKLIGHLKSGKSVHSFSGSIGVSRSTIDTWVEQNEEFAEAMEIAKSVNLGTLEEIALDQATGESKGNAAILQFLMKNQHADIYKDKQHIETEGGVVFQIDTGIPVPQGIEQQPFEVEAEVIEEAETVLDEEDLL